VREKESEKRKKFMACLSSTLMNVEDMRVISSLAFSLLRALYETSYHRTGSNLMCSLSGPRETTDCNRKRRSKIASFFLLFSKPASSLFARREEVVTM